MKPTVGRIVHFVPPSENVGPASIKLVAAMITQVNGYGLPGIPAEETVEIVTFGPNSVYFQHSVPYAEAPTPGHWSWPPKV